MLVVKSGISRCGLLSVTAFEMMSRCYPHEGLGQPEIMRLAAACFEYDEELFEDFDMDADAQMRRWLRRNPLPGRRPDAAQVEVDCPPALLNLVQECWADEVSDVLRTRPGLMRLDCHSHLTTTEMMSQLQYRE